MLSSNKSKSDTDTITNDYGIEEPINSYNDPTLDIDVLSESLDLEESPRINESPKILQDQDLNKPTIDIKSPKLELSKAVEIPRQLKQKNISFKNTPEITDIPQSPMSRKNINKLPKRRTIGSRYPLNKKRRPINNISKSLRTKEKPMVDDIRYTIDNNFNPPGVYRNTNNIDRLYDMNMNQDIQPNIRRIDNRMMDDRIIDDRIMNDRMIDDRIMNDRIMNNRIMNDRMMNNRMMDNRMMDNRIMNDRMMDNRMMDNRMINNGKMINDIDKEIPLLKKENKELKYKIQRAKEEEDLKKLIQKLNKNNTEKKKENKRIK